MIARILMFLLLLARLSTAERLPIRRYTTEDGLPSDRVRTVMRDTSGFLWMATGEGLSRFDGYSFTNFGIDKGVPGPSVLALLQTRDGTIWAGTTNGLTRLAPGASRFEALHLETHDDEVYGLLEDHNGRLWAGTETGLFIIEHPGVLVFARRAAMEFGSSTSRASTSVYALAEDRDHTLWLGTSAGLVRRMPDATAEHYVLIDVPGADDRVMQLIVDRDGRLWAGHVNVGLWVIRPTLPKTRLVADGDTLGAAAARQGPPLTDGRVRWPVARGELRHLTTAEGLAGNWVRTGLFEASDGTIWVGSLGLSRIDGDGRITKFSTANGIADTAVCPSAEDTARHLCIGSASSGLMRLARGGMVTYDEADGLHTTRIYSVLDDRELYVVTETGWLHRFDGTRFIGVMPKAAGTPGWGWNQVAFRDPAGSWWVPTSQGLAQFPSVSTIEDLATTEPRFHRQADGLSGSDVFRLYGDTHGDVWISTMQPTSLVRWQRTPPGFHLYSARDGVPNASATSFVEHDGCLFVGFDDGELARSCGGTFERFGADDGIPQGMLEALVFDHAGRLWIAGGAGGAGRVDDPRARHLTVRRYGPAQGLATDRVNAITEDLAGLIYFGTSRGVDRLDPESGRVHHYGLAEGLASSVVQTAMRDHTGALWFGTLHGLNRLAPIPDKPTQLRIAIVGLHVGGVPYPVPSQGELAIDDLELGPDQNQLEISFVGLSAAIGQPLRYQIRLDGVDDHWSAPIDQRSIRYAGLETGSYRFEVRALSPEGVSPPANVSFRVYGPIWKRGWFLAGLAMLLAALAYTIHRWRLARRLEVERVRLRIATDLHDDVGSSLSKISILSDVVSREMDAGRPVRGRLDEISRTARDLVDTAGDIVWSIDPRRDDLDSLVARFRRFVGDLFDGKSIEWTLTAPSDGTRWKLSPEQRRHLFLMLKEAVHNIVRHAACQHVAISIEHADRDVIAEVRDDGCGFVATPQRGGGLANMRTRVAAAGGDVQIESAPDQGTCIRIRVPTAR